MIGSFCRARIKQTVSLYQYSNLTETGYVFLNNLTRKQFLMAHLTGNLCIFTFLASFIVLYEN